MHAALITEFSKSPAYSAVPEPTARENTVVLVVLASALHPRVRSQANGSHYTTTGDLPLVPGVDGVGRDETGSLRYFVSDDGAMADRVLVDSRASIVIPEHSDPVTIAAAMNPAMSSWIALQRRIDFTPGHHVAILGAAGNAGRLAITIARHLGAGRVSAVARDSSSFPALTALGADSVMTFDDVTGASGADVVLDYVWGKPASAAMSDLVRARGDRSVPLTWVQIGSAAGLEAPIESAALRSSALQIVGSGQGSVSTRDILAELPALVDYVSSGALNVTARPVPLHEVHEAWTSPASSVDRLVFVP